MKDLIDKIGTYNIFNYLLPGVLFVAFADNFTRFHLVQQNALLGVFLYYFLGSLISRIGSLIIKPILEGIGFVKYESYEHFISACKVDPKIELFSEINNMYRTLCALAVVCGLLLGYEKLDPNLTVPSSPLTWLFALIIFFVYLFSYKKQTSFIVSRIKKANKK